MNPKGLFTRSARPAGLTRRSQLIPAICLLLSALPLMAANTLQPFQFNDSFEGSNPGARWIIQKVGDGNGGFEINQGQAFAGLNNSWVAARTGWASVGIWVNITSAQQNGATCDMFIVLQPTGTANIILEAFDGTTGARIASKTQTLNSSSNYQSAVMGNIRIAAFHGNTFFRVAISGQGPYSAIRADGFSLACPS